ncbi:MAG: phosphatidylglycerophosphatase A [Proteobacteria bacterium]|nr:phosphatidylglycerophosphatase A [Pseudomonadota bacterium]
METTDKSSALSKLTNNFLLFIVTCGFIGYLPGASGTYASILGCIIVYFFTFSSFSGNVVFICCLTVCSIVCINLLKYDSEDPSYIVIDELVGMLVTMAGHETNLLNIISGFILFRFFDIIKPYPIRRVERLKGGYGVVADDVLAGIFANLLMYLGYMVFKIIRG